MASDLFQIPNASKYIAMWHETFTLVTIFNIHGWISQIHKKFAVSFKKPQQPLILLWKSHLGLLWNSKVVGFVKL